MGRYPECISGKFGMGLLSLFAFLLLGGYIANSGSRIVPASVRPVPSATNEMIFLVVISFACLLSILSNVYLTSL